MKIFAGESSKDFAKEICNHLKIELGDSEKKIFSDGEFITNFGETVRGETVYLVQSTFPPIDNLFELLMMVDAAKRAGAEKIIAVMPYFGYARQDKKDTPRVPIAASLIAKLIETSGVDHIITMDLHAEQIQGYFQIPVSHIYASAVQIPYLRTKELGDVVFASPDMGAAKRTKVYANSWKKEMVICHKYRKEANKIAEMTVIGEVEGKDVVLVDDLIDTAGTICKAADMMLQKGAKSVQAVVTHPVLSGDAYKNIANSQISNLIVTDSIPLKEDLEGIDQDGKDKIVVLPVTELFAKIINNIENHESISVNFL